MSEDRPAHHYGHHAQNDRWIAELVFPGVRGGYFVEAGACGGIRESASYVLEKDLDWTGICVEPGDYYFNILRQRRSCASDARCLADTTGDIVDFVSFPDDLARSGIESLNNNTAWATKHNAATERTKKETVTLGDLLDQHDAPATIDYICLDVEGAEASVLGAFDFGGSRTVLALSTEGGRCDGLLRANGFDQVKNPFTPDYYDHYFVHKSMSEAVRDYIIG